MLLLLIPPVAVILAIVWNAWRSRERKDLSPQDSVEGFSRRMSAIAPLVDKKRHFHR